MEEAIQCREDVLRERESIVNSRKRNVNANEKGTKDRSDNDSSFYFESFSQQPLTELTSWTKYSRGGTRVSTAH